MDLATSFGAFGWLHFYSRRTQPQMSDVEGETVPEAADEESRTGQAASPFQTEVA